MSAPAVPGSFTLPGNPVFIVGFPRSGTTLLQALVAALPRFFSFPETHFYNVVRKSLKVDERGCLEEASIDNAAERAAEKTSFSLPASDIEELKARCREGCVSPRVFFELLVRHLLAAHHPGASFAAPFRWVEKTPNHAYFLEEILADYPGALFLNIVRHPVAAVSSRRRSFPANRETPAAELARLWNRSLTAAEDFGRSHPGRLYSVRYEDLAADPGREMRPVAAYLGSSFSEESLKDLAAAAPGIRHSWETWKKGLDREGTYDGNARHFARMPLTEVLVIQHECRQGMKRWHYRPLRPLRQKLYTLTGWPGPGAGRAS